MIVEHACLDVANGEEQRFEQAFAQAQGIIASMPGFISLRLDRCLENPSRYLFLVEWDRLEDHTEGFRGSTEYQEWRRLLHHFYDPFPVVEHYEPLVHL
jgi:heme-degrading monooxygenase HmoA